MNVLRLIVADKEKKNRPPNPEYQKIEAACKQKVEYAVKFDKDELRKRLSPVEYLVTQERGTER
jgi:peptide-methionine (R)-S-oxide reductase